MVDANTTRATSKKIKDSLAAKGRSEDISVANSLIPAPVSPLGVGAGESSDQAPGGIAQSGSAIDPTSSGKDNRLEKNIANGKILSFREAPWQSLIIKRKLSVEIRIKIQSLDRDTGRRHRILIIGRYERFTQRPTRRAPAALIHPMTKAKTGKTTGSHIIEEEEEDNSPG
jgi:hypothetical protein